MGRREFFGCYLLESKSPKHKGHSYIGFTVNPRRRMRQHNGEISNGANKTKSKRPWEMVLVVYGFPSQIQALQFEWSWQHPEKSLDIREVAGRLGRKARYGVQGKVLLLMEMLRTEPWCYFPLTLQFLSSRVSAERGRCPAPPSHMRVLVAPLEDLPEVVEDAADPPEEEEGESEGEEQDGGDEEGLAAIAGYNSNLGAEEEGLGFGVSWGDGVAAAAPPVASLLEEGDGLELEDPAAAVAGARNGEKAKGGKGKSAGTRTLSACVVCCKAANRTWAACPGCGKRAHVECLARSFLETEGSDASMPTRGQCPGCEQPMVWMEVLAGLQNAGWENKGRQKRRGGKAKADADGDGGSPTGAAGKKAGRRGENAAAAGAAADVDEPGAIRTAAAARGGKPRGKKAAAPAGAGLAELGGQEEEGPGGLGSALGERGIAGGAAGVAAAAAKRKGRPRKVEPPAAFAHGAAGVADAQLQRRRKPGPAGVGVGAAAAQLQPSRQLWEAAAEPLDVPEAAAPWEDFNGLGNEQESPSCSSPSLVLSARGWAQQLAGLGGAAAVAAQPTSGRGGGPWQQQRHPLGAAASEPSVVVLSDSDSDGGVDGPLLPLVQRLQRQQWVREAAGAEQDPVRSRHPGPAGFLDSPHWHSGAAERLDSPPTGRLGSFRLASASTSPTRSPFGSPAGAAGPAAEPAREGPGPPQGGRGGFDARGPCVMAMSHLQGNLPKASAVVGRAWQQEQLQREVVLDLVDDARPDVPHGPSLQRAQQQHEQQPEVIELVSPSLLPLRDRLVQAQQALPPLAHRPAAGPDKQALPRQASLAQPGSQAVPGGGLLPFGLAAVGVVAPGGAQVEGQEAKPKRPRAYARRLRPQPRAAMPPPSLPLGPGQPPTDKSRAMASPRGTPSPAPLRKRVQQQQGEGAAVGGDGLGPASGGGWWRQPQLERGGGGSLGGSLSRGGPPCGGPPRTFAGGAADEDDVIVISD